MNALLGHEMAVRMGLVLLTSAICLAAGGCAGRRAAVDLPPVDRLPVIEELPDPFVMADGRRVATREDWARRREEIKAIVLHYEYGRLPPAPGNVRAQEVSSTAILDGAATEKRLLLSMGPGRKVEVRVCLVVPAGKGPFPVIVRNDGDLGKVPVVDEIVRRGYILAEYVRTDLDPDAPDAVGPAQAAYPDYDWGTLGMWAWGGMRVIDYLVTLDVVDKSRIALTGHSRGGKTALLAGALDERIALVVPNGSGAGGAGCYRVQGEKSETLGAITDPKRFAYWFHPRLREFMGQENRLPFDQHFLKALVAPRALLSTDALGDLWANPLGTQQTHVAALPVFEFLGARGKCGLSFRQGGHAQNEEDWQALLDFADQQFFGKAVARRFDALPFPDAKPAFSWAAPPKRP